MDGEETESDVVDGLLGIRRKKRFKISSSLNQQVLQTVGVINKTNSICCTKFQIGHPCLHYLAKTGDFRNLILYLDTGNNNINITEEIISFSDQYGRTALHYAAGFTGTDDDANKCVKLLLESLKLRWMQQGLNEFEQEKLLFKFVNAIDTSHETALYLAVKQKHLLVCGTLLENMADWDIKNKRGKSSIMKIFKKLPELVEILIKKRTRDFVQYKNPERTILSIDFGLLIGHPTEEEIKSKNSSIYEEMSFISNVCYTPLEDREKILNHVIVKIFVWLKWRNIHKYFWVARIFQIAWFILYFLFLVTVYRSDCPYSSKIQYNFTWFNFNPKLRNEIPFIPPSSEGKCHISTFGSICSWILLITVICDCIIFELLPLNVRFKRYWYPMKKKSIWKYYERSLILAKILHPIRWIFLITIFLNVIPILFMDLSFNEVQYVIAAIGVALTWHQILLQVGKISWLKVYVKMLLMVLLNISLVLLIYIALILAFASVFCILLPGVPSFSSFYEAILKISTFFIGEVDYEDTFYNENSADISASFGISMLFYGIAIIILHVALLNFLIGLTITNIQDITKYSDLWANYSRIWQIFLMETFLAQPFPFINIFSRLKLKLLKNLMLIDIREYKKLNYNERSFVKEIQIDHLPKPFHQEIRDLQLFVLQK